MSVAPAAGFAGCGMGDGDGTGLGGATGLAVELICTPRLVSSSIARCKSAGDPIKEPLGVRVSPMLPLPLPIAAAPLVAAALVALVAVALVAVGLSGVCSEGGDSPCA